ncbi:stage 0 sporulation protein J [Thalassobacillus devorans]|uniref:Stage 0 sporulation protein J n=1 Tax=Thalassobacillus devorans TaxID=279813 RepID=A0ABQ1PD78_9BACI|nr:ParB/RepB/Spo0J family partition protein [Thalassobacillus devorans]NIK29206.1 ParB family chromosome partitioning protein [Thalassobacillus devorans]GGC94916.1 stage 0 sporulation protein J [Thalassobacillus devorans]
MAKGLGKGLNAIFSDFENTKEESIKQIPVKQCRPNPYQPRKTFHPKAIQELKESIEEHGILQPLIVRKSIKGYEIVVGERRYRAADTAGLEAVPAVVRELTDEQMMELALLENLQREDLSPVEEAQAYKQLIHELGITQETLAKRLGKSRSHIANLVRLLTLPEPIIGWINEGKLSMGHGRALLGLKDKDKLLPVADKIQKEYMNVRQVELLITQLNDQTQKKKEVNRSNQKKDVFLQEQEEALRNHFGTGVTIHRGKRKGKIEIEFFSDDDLNRILGMLETE